LSYKLFQMNLAPKIILLFAVILPIEGYSQESNSKRPNSLSIEFQQYPAGSIPQLMIELGLTKKSAMNVRIGYNIVRHGDLGKHDDERGGGAGLSIGFRKYLKEAGNGFLYGIRSDIWFNSVDWTNNSPMISGNTKVTVLQPSANLGYQFKLSEDLSITPTVSLGAEINVSTNGDPVGEGAIGLVGIEVSYHF